MNPKNWKTRGWVALGMLVFLVFAWAPDIWSLRQMYKEAAAFENLPKTSDYFEVSYTDIGRNEDGHLVVFSDGRVLQDFEGRYRVSLRARDTRRLAWTPEWSGWIEYFASAVTKYDQPETLEWWAGIDDPIEPPPGSWLMETCWQARIVDEVLGPVELVPLCITETIDAGTEVQSIQNEAMQ